MKLIIANLSKQAALPAMLLGLSMASPAIAAPKQTPAKSSAFGKTLAQWQDTYARWLLGDLNLPPDANGNAVADGVVLMPLPNAPGDGTPASLSITLKSGQPFTMPMLYLLGT